MKSYKSVEITRSTSNFLDIIRGVSAQLVVLGHLIPLLFSEAVLQGDSPWVLRFIGSWAHYAVMSFFVASGFLVGGKAKELIKSDRFVVTDYAIARLTRLWIVLLPALVLTFFLDKIAFSFFQGWNALEGRSEFFKTTSDAIISDNAYSLSTLAGNALFIQTILVPRVGTNVALWSLANEFWYYALFPALTIAFVRKKLAIKIAAGVVAAFILLLFALPLQGSFKIFGQQLYVYFLVWLLGAFTYSLQGRIGRGATIFALLPLVVAFVLLRNERGLLQDFLVALIVSLAILLSPSPGKFFPENISSWMAKYSFSLYAIHVPIIFCMLSVFSVSRQDWSEKSAAMLMFIYLLVNISSLLFYFLTERYTDKVRKFITTQILKI